MSGLSNFKLVHEAHEQTQQALHEYSVNCYPQIAVSIHKMHFQISDLPLLTFTGLGLRLASFSSGKQCNCEIVFISEWPLDNYIHSLHSQIKLEFDSNLII